MINFVKKSISSLKSYVVPKEDIYIKLDANENPYNLLNDLKEEWIEKVKDIDINRYPDTDSDDLRISLSQYVGLKKENIICGNGSDEIIQLIIHTFVDKDEYVITHSPTFSMYKILTTIGGGKIIEVPSDEKFKVDVEKIIEEANSNRAKLIFLCNPNNPTGTIIPREDIENIINKTKSIVVVDEAYYEFLGESVVDLVSSCDRLIVLRTLSKAFALAGARVGYGVAHEKIMDLLYRVKSPYNLNGFSQAIGKLFIENIKLINQSIETIKEERNHFINELRNMKNVIVYPSGANFILIKTEKSEELLKVCKSNKISIRAFKEDLLRNCIRITVGTKEENEELLKLLRKVV